MKKRTVIAIALISTTMIMSGCGIKQAIPELSQEQSKQVAEYAVSLLLRYDKNYESRLLSDEQLEKELARLEQEAKVLAEKEAQEQEKLEKEEQEKQELADTQVVDNTSGENITASVNEFYGIDGIDIKYSGYQTVDEYPESSSDTLFFSMSASAGKKLVVVNFNVTNVSGEEKKLDMISISPQFYISINGNPKVSTMATMLLDDLSTYSGTLGAGESTNLVLVAQIESETADNISSILITMKNESQIATIQTN